MNEPDPPMSTEELLRSVVLRDVYTYPDSDKILFELMLERDPSVNISHKRMPTWVDHCKFIESHPYRKWYLIEAVSWDAIKHIHLEPGSLNYATGLVGACYLTRMNEIGIFVFQKYQQREFALKALNTLITRHKPLKAILGVRSGRYLAHMHPANGKSLRLFTRLGFTHLCNTYVL